MHPKHKVDVKIVKHEVKCFSLRTLGKIQEIVKKAEKKLCLHAFIVFLESSHELYQSLSIADSKKHSFSNLRFKSELLFLVKRKELLDVLVLIQDVIRA